MPNSPGFSAEGSRDVHFEETLSMRDSEGAGNLITVTRVLAVFLIVSSLGSLVLVVMGAVLVFVDMAGGVEMALTIVEDILLEGPLPVVSFLLFGLASVGIGLLLIVGFVRQLGRAFDKQIHVRVTEMGVTVQRTGSAFWQSSGTEIPFDAITAVEYLDPDESSTRIELSDVRAQRFFAGRRQKWIRIERDDGPVVYIGSDRPIELAETITRRSPGVKAAEPF